MPEESKIEESNTVIDRITIQMANTVTSGLGFFAELGLLAKFNALFFLQFWRPPYEFKEFVKQCFSIGVKSIPLVALTGFIMGLVLTIQSQPTLAEFGAESWLPAMVAISMIREIGPVITSLIFAGKVGSSIGAELASMNVTEQIDAMEVSGVNPYKYIVVTRVLATTMMLPLLVIMACTISLVGAYLGVNITGEVSFARFFAQVFDAIAFKDVFPALIKTVFFGFAIGLVGCYRGYTSNKGTEGVGEAANSAVVSGSIAIVVLDVIAVQLTSILT